MTPHLSRLDETVQMRGHNRWFYAELSKIIPNYHQILFYLELCFRLKMFSEMVKIRITIRILINGTLKLEIGTPKIII